MDLKQIANNAKANAIKRIVLIAWILGYIPEV